MKDDQTPATKADLEVLRASIEGRFDLKLDQLKEEIMRHFDLVAEKLRHDLVGIHRDKISVLNDTTINHEHRIRHLESAAGVMSA